MPSLAEAVAVTVAVLLALASVVLAVVAAATMPQSEPRSADPAASCAEWTDGCVICLRTPGGPACSTPGFACVTGALRCLRR